MLTSATNFQFSTPFVAASFSVLSAILGEMPMKGSSGPAPDCTHVQILVSVVGEAQGHIVFAMSQETATAIASAMICSPIEEFDQLAASAIAELCNMICGTALIQLSDAGFSCDLAPPSIVIGSGTRISGLDLPETVIPLVLAQGACNITVALQPDKHAKVAA